MPDPLHDQLQSTLGAAYVLERELGGGGMSRVFLAEDVALGRRVVVKVLAPALAEGLSAERFGREVRLAARLQHPNVVPVLTAGTLGPLPFYTMPFIDGASLRDRIAAGQIPLGEALPILRDTLRALGYAHAQGVVHRDIKPENVLLTGGAAVVADFGIAKAVTAARTGEFAHRAETLTQVGMAIGTPAYMAPEQAAGEPDVDHRADLYAWGLIAWEMLAGRHPFAGRRSAQAFIAAQMLEDPAALDVVVPEVPAAVAELVMHCCVKDPDARPRDAATILRALDAAAATPATMPSVSPVAAGTMPSLAVLPFANLSRDADDEYLSDGITEELIGTLGRTRGVRVCGRGSTFALKGQSPDPRTLRQRLGVTAVLLGSVRRAGSRIRVRAELVSATDGFQLWSEQFDRELADILVLEAEIAQRIASALRGPLTELATPVPDREPVIDPEAYELYLRGRYAWAQRTAPTSATAVALLEQAVQRAPDFAPAWAALADAWLAAPVYGGVAPAEAWPKARAAAERALERDPDLAEAHTSLAYGTMLYEWDWDAADRSFGRAIAANPAYATAHHWYADFLAGRGRLDEALASMEHARTLDPLSRMIGVELGWALGLLGRRREALAQLDGVLRLDPNFAHAYLARGLVRAADGDLAGAVADERRALELGGFHVHPFAVLIYATAQRGDRAEALRLLEELHDRGTREHIPPFCLALAYTGLGDLDSAFTWLERGVAERDELLAENFCEPLFAPLHADGRVAPIFARLGIDPPQT